MIKKRQKKYKRWVLFSTIKERPLREISWRLLGRCFWLKRQQNYFGSDYTISGKKSFVMWEQKKHFSRNVTIFEPRKQNA